VIYLEPLKNFMPMSQLSILLIEDDPDDVELMREALKNLNIQYTMESISQGDRVLPYLTVCKKFPNVIVLDLNLPKLHGREVLQFIKGSDKFKNIPVAVLTTASSQKEKEYCLSAGADVFLTKPSTVEGFNKTIYSILDIASRNN
jgi:CheY-like chemotaxis protein